MPKSPEEIEELKTQLEAAIRVRCLTPTPFFRPVNIISEGSEQ